MASAAMFASISNGGLGETENYIEHETPQDKAKRKEREKQAQIQRYKAQGLKEFFTGITVCGR